MKILNIAAAVALGLAGSVPSWAQDAATGTPVTTSIAARAPIEQVFRGLGRVRPLIQANSASQFDGRIVEILTRPGEIVTQNQPLALLRPKDAERTSEKIVTETTGHMIVAGISGRVVNQFKDIGDVVPAGTPVFRIVSQAGARIRINLPIEYAPMISYDTVIRYDNAGTPVQTTPANIIPYDGSATGTFPVEVVAQGVALIDAVYAVDVVVQKHPDNIVIPRSALLENNGAFTVFVVEAGKAVEKSVTVGIQTPSVVEILSGIDPGAEVITSGNYNLAPDTPVKATPGA